MSEEVLSNYPDAFPIRFRGYDRDAVHEELHQLRNAVDFMQADRDQAVARALALEAQLDPGRGRSRQPGQVDDTPTSPTSATVQWLLDTAQQEAQQIRRAAEDEAARYTQEAERLLRQRVEMVEQAQHEADVCRAQAAEEARAVVHEALEQANVLIRGLRESEAALREIFESGRLSHRMPPPRQSMEQSAQTAQAAQPEQTQVVQQVEQLEPTQATQQAQVPQ